MHLVQPVDWIVSDCFPRQMPVLNATAHLGIVSTRGGRQFTLKTLDNFCFSDIGYRLHGQHLVCRLRGQQRDPTQARAELAVPLLDLSRLST